MRTNQDIILTMENHGEAYFMLPNVGKTMNSLCLHAGNHHNMSRRNLEKHAAIVIESWMLPCEISA